MFEGKRAEESAENLRKLQEKILGPNNSSVYVVNRKRVDNIQQVTKNFSHGGMQTRIRVIFKK